MSIGQSSGPEAGSELLLAAAWQRLFGSRAVPAPASWPLPDLAARLGAFACQVSPGAALAIEAGPGAVTAGLLAARAPANRVIGLVDGGRQTADAMRYWLRPGAYPANLELATEPPPDAVIVHPADISPGPLPGPAQGDVLLLAPERQPGGGPTAPGLSDTARGVAYWSARGLTLAAIAGEMRIGLTEVLEAASDLMAGGYAVAAAVGGGVARWHVHATRGAAMLDPADSTLPALWRMRVAVSADRPLIRLPDGGCITCAGMDAMIGAACAVLAARGLRKGDRVVIQPMQNPDFVAFAWACWHLGIVVLLAPAAATGDAMNRLAARAGAVALLVAVSDGAGIAGDATTKVLAMSIGPVDGLAPPRDAGVAPEDAAFILTTSGTTNEAKLVVHSHRSAISAGRAVAEAISAGPDDCWTAPMGVADMGGLRASTISPVWSGGSWLPMPEPEPGHAFRVAQALAGSAASVMFSYPVLLGQLADLAQARRIDLPSGLRVIHTGGSAVKADARRRLASVFDAEIMVGFAMTELSPAIQARTAPDRDDGEGLGHTHDCLTSIRDARGETLPDGTEGTLWLLSDRAMSGYLRDGRLDRSSFAQGWLRNGDTVRREADGRHFHAGRDDAWIKLANGLKVHLSTVVECLAAHPDVSDATAIACVDAAGQEGIVAFVSIRDAARDAGDLERHVRQTLGADFVPAAIVPVASLPRNARDKISLVDLFPLLPARWRAR